MNLAGLPTGLLQARVEHGYAKSKLAMIVPMEVLTPASPSDLPPLGELVAEEPFWRYPSATIAGAGAAHLCVWLTTGAEPGHLAVVTENRPHVGRSVHLGAQNDPDRRAEPMSIEAVLATPNGGTARVLSDVLHHSA
jgi:hypothetical protein